MKVDPNMQAKDRLLLAMLPHVVFDGWSKRSIIAGQRDLKKDGIDPSLLFPRGMRDVALHFGEFMDREMTAELSKINLEEMPIRERIASCVTTRLKLLAPHKEAVRRLLSFLALPGNQLSGLKMTLRTVDIIWYAAGDSATDFNYYTKRGLLASIYASTILFWLSDTSKSQNDTRLFLSRRINEVMKIPGLKASIVKQIKWLSGPLGLIKRRSF